MHWPCVWHWGQWSRAKLRREPCKSCKYQKPQLLQFKENQWWDLQLPGMVLTLLLLPLWVGMCRQVIMSHYSAAWSMKPKYSQLDGTMEIICAERSFLFQRIDMRPREGELLTQQQISESEPSNLSPRQVLSLLNLLGLSHPCYIKGHCPDEVLALTVTLAS